MSSVVLSSSVRQNLLSLQSTADLLSTTQSRLSTGKKVNSAIDNPTNYFTAQSLDNRSSDINNLLDGISNGVQVLNAANTGITSLQKLVDSAKSVANQALQATVGYSTKSTITGTAVAGATASDLRGTATAGTAGALTAGTFTAINVSGTGTAATSGSKTGSAFSAPIDVSSTALSFSVTADAGSPTTVTINSAAVSAYNLANATSLSATSLSASDVSSLINAQLTTASVGASSSVVGGAIKFTSSSTGTTSNVTIGTVTGASTSGITAGAGTAGAALVPAASQSFTVALDGGTAHTVTLNAANVAAYNTAKGTTASASALTAADVAGIANYQIGSNVASVVGGALTFTSTTTGGTSSVATSAVTTSGGATGGTGITATSNTGTAGTTALGGLTLTIGATGTNGVATNITFGDGTNGTVKSLNDLNDALASNNLQASIDSTGVLSITTTNDAASSTIGTVGGTATGTGKIFAGQTNPGAPVKDAAAQLTRSNLVTQYNNILDQITSTAQDASYNGTNLLNGDNLKLTFNETGKSTLNVTGTTLNATGLGLSKLTEGTDFTDNSSANKAISSLGNASSTLRTQASTLGSNLSVVQIRQDFSKNLINVLTTGSSNLTLADTNEEAANSQALSTRQSIAVSALSLANTSQQSVLTLLR